jgi:hypothetical protein
VNTIPGTQQKRKILALPHIKLKDLADVPHFKARDNKSCKVAFLYPRYEGIRGRGGITPQFLTSALGGRFRSRK